MFPESIQKAPFFARGSYRIILYVVLIVWLLPLIGVFIDFLPFPGRHQLWKLLGLAD